ncbi:glycosyltransferase family 8 protein [Streptomyces sp. NPDC102384]|uniref:glycosyltransferase family 8 protein n=1 Tax=Streptomyces sp. NPDC102384 TaxID=3366166 RepID=UPI003811B36E
MNDMQVVCAADERYVIPLAASMRSVMDNLKVIERVQLVVLSCGISANSRRLLEGSWDSSRHDIEFIEVGEDAYKHLPVRSGVSSYLTTTTYARLSLPETLPQDWKRVIYLDVDTITLRSLDALWDIDLHGAPIAAVQDVYTPYISSPDGVQNWRALNLDPQAQYFNAGVMVVDLEIWRREQVAERALKHIETHSDQIVLFDQEGLNAVLGGRFRQLDPVWNMMNYWHKEGSGTARHSEIVDNVRIRHFNGRRKPWEKAGADVPDRDAFFRYLDRTRWAGWRP